jgi:signal peptidase I
VGVALPELPDDRRAPPRRYTPVDQQGPGRNQGPVPTGQRPATSPHAVPPVGGMPGAGPRPGRPLPPPNGAAPNYRGPNGSVSNGVPPGWAPNGSVPNGSVPNGGPGGRPVPPGGRIPPPRHPAPVNGHPVDGRQAPPRRPDPVDDEPTVVLGDLLGAEDDFASENGAQPGAEAPGRHRRRAGASPGARPAAEYREQAEASGRKARTGRRRRPTFWKELPLLVVVALLLTFLIQTFLGKVYVIPSGSMETTLHGCTGCNNDRVLVDKISFGFSDPAPGDVVVFRGPDSWSSEIVVQDPGNPVARGFQQFGSLIGLAPPDEKDFVKRVIAVGGQTVSCCDSRNRVMVDGEPLDEPYVYYLPEAGPARQSPFGPITVPEGHLWMMGDSRNNSADSRVPDHGPVPVDNVIGKASVIVLPFARFGWIDAVDPQSTAVGMAGTGEGAPLALGLLGTLPLAAGRRRLQRRDAELRGFLPGHRRP